MIKKILSAVIVSLSISFGAAHADTSIPPTLKVADVSSYSAWPQGIEPFRAGMKMAAEDINKNGGVLGRMIEIVEYDDRGSPESALQVIEPLMSDDSITFITGCNLANVELAFASYAKRYKRLYTSACSNSDKFFLSEAHDYAFRVSGTPVIAINKMLAERAARQSRLKWAGISHNYEWGQSNHEAFKTHLKSYQPDAEWVVEQWPSIGKLDAGSAAQALLRKKPDAIYTALWGSDLVEFIREGKKRGLFENAVLVGGNIGRPEFLEQMGAEMPEGFITFGTLPGTHESQALRDFDEKWRAEMKTNPRFLGMIGYSALQTLAQAVEKAGSTDQADLIEVLKGLEAETIYGTSTVHPIAQVVTNPMWVGITAVNDDGAYITDAEYLDGQAYFLSDDALIDLRGGQ